MNMEFWRRWIFLWAVMPVFSAFFYMASHRLLHDTVEIQTHHQWGIIIVFFLSSILYFLAPYLVLRKYIQGYGLEFHFYTIATLILGWCLAIWLFVFERDFYIAVKNAKIDAPVLFLDILGLPWWKLLACNITTTAIIYAGPIFIVCRAANRVSNFPKVMLFVLLAFTALAISEAFYEIFISRLYSSDTLNGKPWGERIAIIASWSVSSVIGASISAIGFASLINTSTEKKNVEPIAQRTLIASGFRLAIGTAIVLWGALLASHYVLGPHGYSSNFISLRKALTSAPETDISSGQEILKFSHFLNVKTYRHHNSNYANLQISPDGKHVVLIAANGKNGKQLTVFEVATGKKIATLGKPANRHENLSTIWTKDKKHILVRRRGAPIKIGGYTRYDTKLTLYALTNYQKVSEWQSTKASCIDTRFVKVSMLDDMNNNLIVLCQFSYAKEVNPPIAIQLSLPQLKQVKIHHYPTDKKDSKAKEIFESGGSIYAILEQSNDPFKVILLNLTNPQMLITLDNPTQEDRGGGLTSQEYITNAQGKTISVRYCGGVNKVSNPPKISNKAAWGPSFCRTLKFGVSDGKYVGYEDGLETRVRRNPNQPRKLTLSSGSWQFTSEIFPASKTGKLQVSKIEGGEYIQIIDSPAQVPVLTLNKLGLLFTHRIDSRQIAVYKIAR